MLHCSFNSAELSSAHLVYEKSHSSEVEEQGSAPRLTNWTLSQSHVMFQPTNCTNQHSVHAEAPPIQGSSALVPMECDDDINDNVQNEGLAVSKDRHSRKVEGDLRTLGMKIRQHEENIILLYAERRTVEDSILHLQESSNTTTKIGNVDNPRLTNDEEVNKQILKHENSAAGMLCQLMSRYGAHTSNLTWTKDIVGIVAMLGKVDDDNISRLFSEYLGLETMLAIVCRTYEGVKALEQYDNEGCIDKNIGLHGLGTSIGRALDGRFQVICLESLSPYAGKYVFGDPQQKLDILIPRLPNGDCPTGFLGFAVNMVHLDSSNLFFVTPSGYGLRETLFYNIFSRLQVYKTRADMIQALPCISDGALSLDGGMVRSCGVFALGNREDVDVRFPRPERSMRLDNHVEIERQMKDMKWKKEKILEELKRERMLLDMAKFTFKKMKKDYVRNLAQRSLDASQGAFQ